MTSFFFFLLLLLVRYCVRRFAFPLVWCRKKNNDDLVFFLNRVVVPSKKWTDTRLLFALFPSRVITKTILFFARRAPCHSRDKTIDALFCFSTRRMYMYRWRWSVRLRLRERESALPIDAYNSATRLDRVITPFPRLSLSLSLISSPQPRFRCFQHAKVSLLGAIEN